MPHKLSKDALLYMEPTLLDRANKQLGHGAACGKCMMYLKDISKCSILVPSKVSGERGVCGLFVGGKPVTSEDHSPMHLVPKVTAGYLENSSVPTHCGNCSNFSPDNYGAEGDCKIVEGKVHEYGCCNGWMEK